MKLTGMIAALSCGLAFFAACTKSENNPNNSNNNNNNNSNLSAKGQILVAGKWQPSAHIATATYMGKDTTVDYFVDMDECDKDDFIQFADDGTGNIDENTNKCAHDNQVENFTWALLDNDTRLALVDSNPDTFDIVELTTAQLKFKINWTNSSGTPVTEIFTYKNIK